MIVVNRYALKVAFVSFVSAVVATITVIFALQGLCETYRDQQPISLHVQKRILKDDSTESECDVLFVVKGQSRLRDNDPYKSVKIYNCSKVGTYSLQTLNDYECMFYAMLTNPNCKGYLFLGREIRRWKRTENLLHNDLTRIWYKGKTNTKRLQVKIDNKNLLKSKHVSTCSMVIKELALLNIAFKNSEESSNGSWQRPWNVEIAMNALLWNGKGKFACFRREVETFYVPVKYRETFLGVASILNKVKMPDDVGVLTILKSLDLERTFLAPTY
ncbi:uncharacterized protein LOC114524839 [Dendronephthya gigantea]|uniref:uncharacterized protein LOC114524839 n=1 Tax=Dendronephthya gigantea TaxID=151771 RepID=UPI00106A226B|nr:uncharacterized protein LOC114524839 [Dendronephthya gigantea]